MYAIHAPAKVNLYLHVGPVRADGRHPLDSLVVFADASAADRISFEPGSNTLDFQVIGQAGAVDTGPDEDNLVIRAIRAIEAHTDMKIHGKLILDKRLPVAAGIGGGSADAAATLHLINGALSLELSEEKLVDLARPLGGDVPVCVIGEPVLMRGDGDRPEAPDGPVPEMHALLACPDVACPTGPVFRKFDETDPQNEFHQMASPSAETTTLFLAKLGEVYRNDLQDPAIALVPVIKDVLNCLDTETDARFFAMSGSGATCFALFEQEDAVFAAKRALEANFPTAWIRSTKLGKAGFDPDGFSF